MEYKYLFGPVPSRRLGMSLGVDLVPHKTCTLDCIYCECGKTTDLTLQRREYVSLQDVLDELKDYLDTKPELDYITFSGSGEPTMHNGIGRVISFIKTYYPGYKIALLTNSTLLYEKGLREEIMDVDLIVPSLDAVSDTAFDKINRAADTLSNHKVIEGLLEFCKDFTGKIWLEVFVVPGVNDTDEELALLKDVIEKISPEKIQLNSLDRPGTEDWLTKATEERMLEIRDYLKPLPAEIVAKYYHGEGVKGTGNTESVIIATIKRRPCTIEDLKQMTGVTEDVLKKCLDQLADEKKIEVYTKDRGIFYRVV